jgi:CheY-like chemotaxis protein
LLVARILIVEDDRDVTQLLVSRLHGYGHVITTAPSGPIALKRVGFDFQIDIAVLDINLPGMDGFELLDELRRHPELDNPRLPAVFLSGSKEHEDQERAIAMRATYLPKPFVSGELQGAILVALNGLPDSALP